MSFLAPALLAGLAALAVPVWLHLTHRQRSDVVDFPSLMFLRKIPYRSVRRQKIRHWFLLALRCLALILLVAAFARPVLDRTPLAVAGDGPPSREVVVLVDRSFSMAYGDRWGRALDAARRVTESLGPGDRASLILFDQGAVEAARSVTDPAALRAALSGAAPGSRVTRYGPALRLAGTILEGSSLSRKEAILISDFQKEGWTGEEDFHLPPGAALIPVPVGGEEAGNAAVASLSFHRERVQGRERLRPTATVLNLGRDTLAGLPVTLEVEGTEIQTLEVTVPPGEGETATFGAFTVTEPDTRGLVRIPADSLPVDDALRFVVSPGAGVGVLVLEGGRRGGESLFLRRALDIGERPAFDVRVKSLGAFGPADLTSASVVILAHGPFPGGEAGRALVSFVEGGGGLLLALGERSAFPDPADRIMPGTVGAPRDRAQGRGGTLSSLEYSHPAFELFRTPRSGDFTGARFFRYRPMEVDPELAGAADAAPGDEEGDAGAEDGDDDPPVSVLARFDDGAPALVERRVGDGRVLVWTSTLDNFWNDLPLQPVYLPFVHRMVRHLADWREPDPWFTAGQVLRLEGSDGAEEAEAGGAAQGPVASLLSWGEGDRVVRTPSGEIRPLPSGGESGFLPLDEHGFWEIRVPGARGGTPPLATLAVNPDPAESELERMDPEELARAVTQPGTGGGGAGGEAGAPTLEDREQRQGLWRYLLMGALLILAGETVISNRLSRAERSVTGAGEMTRGSGTVRTVGGRR